MTITLNEPLAAPELVDPPAAALHPTRLMGDCVSDYAPELVRIAGELDIVAPYVTGSPAVKWTEQQRGLFPAPRWQQATVDQGFTGSPVPDALVRDVEAGAWTIEAALREPWDNPRKTIYIQASSLPALAKAGWRGRVWVALWSGSRPLIAPPVPDGMTCVAQQYASPSTGSGGPFDLSAVFDANWPDPVPVDPRPRNKPIPAPPRPGISAVITVLADDGRIYLMVWDEDGNRWTAPRGAYPIAD